MKILIKDDKKDWVEVPSKKYKSEAELQSILYEKPDLIPIKELGDKELEPKVFIKELGLPGSGNTDLVGIDELGGITILECKLATNPESKRTVLGQVLEYAAYLWEMPYEEFNRRVREKEGRDLVDLLREKGLSEEWSADEFRNTVTTSLHEGKFRLMIAVDSMNDELRRIIEYINSRGPGSIHLYAIEMKFFAQANLQALVPNLFGAVSPPPTESRPRPEPISVDEFLEMAQKQSGDKVREILQWVCKIGKEKVGEEYVCERKLTEGSFRPRVNITGKNVSIFKASTQGYIQIFFDFFAWAGLDKNFRTEYWKKLNAIQNVIEGKSGSEPSFDVKYLENGEAKEKFKEAIDWFVQEAEKL